MVSRVAWSVAALGIALVPACSGGSAPAQPTSKAPFYCQSEYECSAPAPECALVELPGRSASSEEGAGGCSTIVVDGGAETDCVTMFYGNESICVSGIGASTCTRDTDCVDPVAFCSGPDVGLTSGICSRRCDLLSNVGPCGGQALCAVNPVAATQVCLESCQKDAWCPAGFACDPNYDPMVGPTQQSPQGNAAGASTSQWLCVPYCTTDAQCSSGACNGYTHRCGTVDDALQDDGQACALPSDCRSGQCETGGFLDGLCDSTCVQPDPSFYTGPTLPSSNCPGTEVCAPDPSGGTNVLSRCFPRCTADADCRPDYVCIHPQTPGPGPRTLDGFCDARRDSLSTL
jgi:hypothetical protein